MNKVYSIVDDYQRVHTLLQDTNILLIHISRPPYGHLTPGYFVRKYGEQYHYLGTLLGGSMPDPQRGLKALCGYLQSGHDLILLSTDVRHNHAVVQMILKAMPGIEVVQPAQVIAVV